MSNGRTRRKQSEKAGGAGGAIGGCLNILGVQIDLEELLGSTGQVQEKLSQLRERLKEAGGKEALSDFEWREGGATVSGFIRTRGILGDEEYHIGTTGRPAGQRPTAGRGRKAPGPPPEEAVPQPPLDIFDEGDEIRIVADVPGANLEDLEMKVEGRTFSLVTKPGARRAYRQRVTLPAAVDAAGMRATCRNGVLDVVLPKARKEP